MNDKSPPRQRRHDQSRQTILDAALDLIIEKGIDRVSLRQIADKADYSPAALYQYFNGKDQIIAGIREQGYQLLGQRIAKILNDSDPIERLIEICLAYIEFACDYSTHFSLMFSVMTSTRQSLEDIPPEQSPYRMLLDAVQHAIESDTLRLNDPNIESISYNLWAMAHGMAALQSSHLQDFQADFRTADRQAFRAYLTGLGHL